MKESIAAIRWVGRGFMVMVMLAAGWLSYKFVTEPGYLAGLVTDMGPSEHLALPEGGPPFDDGVVTSRLPQARKLPQAGGAQSDDTQHRLNNGSAAGTTTTAGSYAPRTTATGGIRTVSREKTAPPPAYQPPVAQRKVVRVGE